MSPQTWSRRLPDEAIAALCRWSVDNLAFTGAGSKTEETMRSKSRKPRLRTKGRSMSEPRFPSDKSVEVSVTLKAYRDQAAIFGANPKPGFSVNNQVGDNQQDAVVAVAEVLNQFRHGFTEGGVPRAGHRQAGGERYRALE